MVLDTLTVVVICLGLSFVLSEVFFRIKYPRVIGQIVTGIILGLPFLSFIFSPEATNDISFLSDLGIIFMLLITGMQIDLRKFKKSGKTTIIISLFSLFVPLGMGFVLMKAMGYSNLIGLIVGIVISLTAEGANLKVLIDLNALNTKIGLYILGAGILDDIFEVIFLALILIITKHSFAAAIYLPLKIGVFILVAIGTYKVVPHLLKVIKQEHSRVATLSFIILFALIVAVISKWLDLGPIIGAFVAGIIIHLAEHKRSGYDTNARDLEAITFAFIIPFFFINIGLNFSIDSLTHNLYIAFMVFIVATVSKLLGAFLAKPFTDMTFRQAHLLGWGLNSRGAIELVIAEVARVNNLIPIEVYSALVVTAILTTLLFPIMMKLLVSADREILAE